MNKPTVKNALIEAKRIYDDILYDDSTKSIAVVELTKLIIEENRRREK